MNAPNSRGIVLRPNFGSAETCEQTLLSEINGDKAISLSVSSAGEVSECASFKGMTAPMKLFLGDGEVMAYFQELRVCLFKTEFRTVQIDVK